MKNPRATVDSLFPDGVGTPQRYIPNYRFQVSGAGLTDAFFDRQPRMLLLDEIDKIPMDVTAVPLSVMESGEVLETKHKRHRVLKLDLIVFAVGNGDKTIPLELGDLYSTFYLKYATQ